MLYEYKLTFSKERNAFVNETATITINSTIDPATLVLRGEYTLGDYEYVQGKLGELEALARSHYDDIIGLHDFTSVECPDGTVVEPT